MAVAIIGTRAGGNAALDQRVMQEVGGPPPGALLRLAGPTKDGWRVLSVWESEAVFEAFKKEKLLPAFQRLGEQPPTFEVWPLEQVRVTDAAAALAR